MSDLDLESLVKEHIDKFNASMSKTKVILVANPLDLKKLNMDDFNTNAIFIPNCMVESGTIIAIQDSDLKEQLYKFSIEHPEGVLKGTKEER